MRLYFSFFLELAILFPSAVYALLPVRRYFRMSVPAVCAGAFCLLLGIVAAGAGLCIRFGWSSNQVLFLVLPLFFAAYAVVVQLSLPKLFFCFFNAAMLSGLCTVLTSNLMAPVLEDSSPFDPASGFVCLGLCLLMGILFFRVLVIQLPQLLEREQLNLAWRWLLLIPLSFTVLLVWANPIHPDYVMIGRVRQVSLVLYLMLVAVLLLLYHIFWMVTESLTRNAELHRQNDLLLMERKRMEELRRYMDHTARLRHDFRQHLLVIDQLSREAESQKLQRYVHELCEEANSSGIVRYSANSSVDAVVSYYAAIARKLGIQTDWNLDLPETLPMPEADYCAMLGNLVENAVYAAGKEQEEQRFLRVTSRLLSPAMLGLTVENSFSGTLNKKENGLPRSAREGHGLGLTSVTSTVKRYNGEMSIKTENGRFSVDILLFLNSGDRR